jgi:hypothetical protein
MDFFPFFVETTSQNANIAIKILRGTKQFVTFAIRSESLFFKILSLNFHIKITYV